MNLNKGCETTEGFISYPKHPVYGFVMPVALDFSVRSVEDRFPPLKEGGELVYVLPGGVKTTLSDIGV